MPAHHKSFDMKVKAVTGETGTDAGQVKALVAAFGNVDHVGDVVMPGAFGKSLTRWAEKGDSIPFIWAHDWSDPWSHLGHVIDAKETDAGLEVEAQLDLAHNEKARQVFRLLKGRRVAEMSFAYDIVGSSPGQRDGQDVNELTELHVLEVGPCLRGANPSTELLGVKSDNFVDLPTLTPTGLAEWINQHHTITPAALTAWATERSPR